MRALGEPRRAIDAYTDALQIHQGMHYVEIVADALEGLAGIAAACRDPARAAQLFGAATHIEATCPCACSICDAVYACDLALARGQLTCAGGTQPGSEGIACRSIRRPGTRCWNTTTRIEQCPIP